MRSHVKKNKEGEWIPAYENQSELLKAQRLSREAKQRCRYFKHIAGIR